MDLLERSGVGRDINRHHYSRGEIGQQLQRPVVQALLRLIRLRNSHAAFGGQFSLGDTDADTLLLQWALDGERIELRVDLAGRSARITTRGPAGETGWLLAGSAPVAVPG